MVYYLDNVNKPYVLVIDIEHDEGRIIQLAAIMVKNIGNHVYQICRSINMYIKQPHVSNFIQDYTHITQDCLNTYGVPLEVAQKDWQAFLEPFDKDDVLVVSHGIYQDSIIMNNNGFSIDVYEQWCTYLMAKGVLERTTDLNLSDISAEAGYSMICQHNAYADALTTLMVFSFLLKIEE